MFGGKSKNLDTRMMITEEKFITIENIGGFFTFNSLIWNVEF